MTGQIKTTINERVIAGAVVASAGVIGIAVSGVVLYYDLGDELYYLPVGILAAMMACVVAFRIYIWGLKRWFA